MKIGLSIPDKLAAAAQKQADATHAGVLSRLTADALREYLTARGALAPANEQTLLDRAAACRAAGIDPEAALSRALADRAAQAA